MAQIQDVKLQIKTISASLRKVIVDFTLAFSKDELGKTFRYDINLRGEDPLFDAESGPIITIGGQLLSDFTFDGLPSKLITATQLEQSFSEKRDISIHKLNEDPGVKITNSGRLVPHDDEIFAEVTLNRSVKHAGINAEMSMMLKKRSPTVTVVGFLV